MTINYSLFAMRKNWPYTREVTIKYNYIFHFIFYFYEMSINAKKQLNRLMEMEAAGLFRMWWKRMTADYERCLKFTEEQKKRILPLNFGNVSGAFYILASGIALSLLTFTIEIIYYYFCWKLKNQNKPQSLARKSKIIMKYEKHRN